MDALAKCPRRSRYLRIAASLAATAMGLSFGNCEGYAQPPDRGDTRTAQGRVRSSTTAPIGEIDGAVLDDGTVIHWPPHMAERFSAVVVRGDRVIVPDELHEIGPNQDIDIVNDPVSRVNIFQTRLRQVQVSRYDDDNRSVEIIHGVMIS
jgi:hypothetical protein